MPSLSIGTHDDPGGGSNVCKSDYGLNWCLKIKFFMRRNFEMKRFDKLLAIWRMMQLILTDYQVNQERPIV